MSSQLVKVYLDTSGGFSRNREIDPEKLVDLPELIRKNLASGLNKFGNDILERILDGYVKAIRVRPRIEGSHLLERLVQAINMNVSTPQREVWLGVFDLGVMDRLTCNEGMGTSSRGWFLNLEDGTSTDQGMWEESGAEQEKGHGSKSFAFVEVEYAVKLASEAADHMKLQAAEREKFMTEVADRFKGRHGEGIMVKLNEPLFWQYPLYGKDPGITGRGKAVNILKSSGHQGYPVLDVLKKEAIRSRDQMKEVAYAALRESAKSL